VAVGSASPPHPAIPPADAAPTAARNRRLVRRPPRVRSRRRLSSVTPSVAPPAE
jgi:hypothetical protein